MKASFSLGDILAVLTNKNVLIGSAAVVVCAGIGYGVKKYLDGRTKIAGDEPKVAQAEPLVEPAAA